MTLRSRIALIAAATTALTAIVVTIFGYGLARNSVAGEVDSSLRNNQQRFARRLLSRGGGIGLGVELPSTPIALVSGAGKVLRSTASGSASVEPIDIEIASEEESAQFSNRVIAGRRYRFLTAPVQARKDNTGRLARLSKSNGGPGLAIVIGHDVGAMNTQLERLSFGFVLLGLLGIALSAVAALVAVRAGTRSLTELHEITSSFSARGESMRSVPITGPPDIARLSMSFNTMLDSLRESRASQQRMIDDAAHELRTPLTSMQTNLDILARARGLSDSERTEITDALLNQFHELRALVDDLGILAEQHTHVPQDFRMVDLRDISCRAMERAQRRTTSVQLQAQFESFSVLAQPELLERAIVNVLDNAIKFSPADSLVTVSLRDGILSIADQGPGVPEHERHRVFDRFWRSDETRSTSGSGLGLAIVSDIVREHRGSVELTENAGGGSLVSIRLPHSSSAFS